MDISMKNPIAVIICNYNKKEYTKRNVESLQRQTKQNFDIYMVDNASTDGSVHEIESTFPNQVKVICNEVNLGGSGGFNTGIRVAMDQGYSFIVLLDNDVVLKEDAIERFYDDMMEHSDIGIMGAKILKMDKPDIIQEFAPTINYSSMTFELNHGGERDEGTLPYMVDCDYVPACALIVRREVVEKIGCFPEENFIYYDDIEWCVKCHRTGYRVVANASVTVWHKGGASVNLTTFASYYLNRNKLRFFMTYMQTDRPILTDERDAEERIERILRDIYEGLYSCKQHGMDNVAKTRMDAFLDALEGVVGKASSLKIREKDDVITEKFDCVIKASRRIRIHMNGLWENTRRILNHIQILESEVDYAIEVELTDSREYKAGQMLGVQINGEDAAKDEEFDLVFWVCQHIYELDIKSFDRKWVDGWRNTIFDEADFEQYVGFESAYKLFKLCFEDRVREAMQKRNGDYAK